MSWASNKSNVTLGKYSTRSVNHANVQLRSCAVGMTLHIGLNPQEQAQCALGSAESCMSKPTLKLKKPNEGKLAVHQAEIMIMCHIKWFCKEYLQ